MGFLSWVPMNIQKDWTVKVECAYSFMLKYYKITVCSCTELTLQELKRKLVIFKQNLEIATTVHVYVLTSLFAFLAVILCQGKFIQLSSCCVILQPHFFSYCVISRIYINFSEKQEKLKQVLFDKLSFLKFYFNLKKSYQRFIWSNILENLSKDEFYSSSRIKKTQNDHLI